MLEIATLGGLVIRHEGVRVTQLNTHKAEAILLYLACTRRSHSRDVLAEMLWEERTQARARGNLRVALASLRKHLGDHLIITRETVALSKSASLWLDVVALEESLPEDTQTGPLTTEALARLESGVALYRGDFLEGFYLRDAPEFEHWIVLERERIRSMFELRMQVLLNSLIALHDWHKAIVRAERWLSLGQMSEYACRALMLAYHGQGDLSRVTTVFRRCTSNMQQELGIAPSEQTRTLYERLLQADATTETLIPVQNEQQALERETIESALVQCLRQPETKILDLPTLAAIYAGRQDLEIGSIEAGVLIRSALHYGVDVHPWLRRLGSCQTAVHALREVLSQQPQRRIRRRIVAALQDLDCEAATDALLQMALAEEDVEVRTQAATAAARRGRLQEVIYGLRDDLEKGKRDVALPALVAVADAYGLPQGVQSFPRPPIGLAYVRRRWQTMRPQIWKQTKRAILGSGLPLFIHGACTPLNAYLFAPEDFYRDVKVLPVPAWSLSGAFGMLFVGGLVTGSIALALGLADAVWRDQLKGWQRILVGALAGLAQAYWTIEFSLFGLLRPYAAPAIYVPAYILYGFGLGGTLSFLVPSLGTRVPQRRQLRRAILVSLVVVMFTIPCTYAGYLHTFGSVVLEKVMYAFLLSMGMGLALAEWPRGADKSETSDLMIGE